MTILKLLVVGVKPNQTVVEHFNRNHLMRTDLVETCEEAKVFADYVHGMILNLCVSETASDAPSHENLTKMIDFCKERKIPIAIFSAEGNDYRAWEITYSRIQRSIRQRIEERDGYKSVFSSDDGGATEACQNSLLWMIELFGKKGALLEQIEYCILALASAAGKSVDYFFLWFGPTVNVKDVLEKNITIGTLSKPNGKYVLTPMGKKFLNGGKWNKIRFKGVKKEVVKHFGFGIEYAFELRVQRSIRRFKQSTALTFICCLRQIIDTKRQAIPLMGGLAS